MTTARFSLAGEQAAASPAARSVSYYGAFTELPVGAVQPRGWIKGWLERQASGLTGHPENLGYPYDTCMFAGRVPPPPVPHGENWWPYEQSGYFVDAAVRLNHLVEDPRLRAISAANLEYILAHAGPAKLGESVWGWPNTVVGRALLAESGATGDPRVAEVLARFFAGPVRTGGRDGFLAEEALWLYQVTGDPALLDVARRVHDRLFLSDPRSFSHVDRIRGPAPLRQHGVTAAEQLKLLPLFYSYTGDPEALELANLAYRKVEDDSLMPDGGIVSSESMGPTAFDSLHETCDLTDWSWSFGYMLLASGDAHWSDAIERITFNALPGAVTKDFRQLQYFSGPNQILASNTACPRIAPTRLSYRAAHDTECCSGNVNRAMPNYVARMWLRTGDGVAAALYGPCELSTVINGRPVSIAEETDYPFRDTITFKIKAAQPAAFALRLRIPAWCASAEIAVNGRPAAVECRPGTFVALNREFQDGDTVALRLPMIARTTSWLGGRGVSVHRGPLVYSLGLEERRVESTKDPEPIRRVLKGNDIQGFPALEFYPASEWRYGMDEAQRSAPEKFRVIESPMTENPFLAENPPVRIEVPLRPLPQWQADWRPVPDLPPADLRAGPHNPADLPRAEEFGSPGEPRVMTLVPLGSTHLRLTMLPVIRREPDQPPPARASPAI